MTSESLTKNLIDNFSIENLQSFFRQKLRSFRKENDDMSHLFDGNTEEKYTNIYKIGEANLKGNDELLVFSAQTQSSLTYKTGKRQQFEMAKKVLQNEEKDAAFFIFYDEDKNFRFSFVKANFEGKTKKYTDFKRYTYFVSKEQTNRTFIEQTEKAEFSDIDSIIEAFSIEPLNKQFYKDISDAFNRLTGVTEHKKSVNQEINLFTPLKLPSLTQKEATKTSKEFAVRLIGRIIFVWFLKNKVSKNGTPLVPTDWLHSKKVENTDSYYHFFLEKLFFQVLNKPLDERIDNILENHEKIPFLNGGLFEAQEEDYYNADKNGLSTNLNTLVIPNYWITDFFQTLERYNFTIDENSLSDQEVSIDPEMLGTIFENLLGEIEAEEGSTTKSKRKSTGSFYTPRPIVDYMVEESLITYLKQNTNQDEEKLRELFKEDDKQSTDFEDREQIIDAFLNVKVLDPACGSGAFPISVLQRINFALQKIDPNAEIFKERLVKSITNSWLRKKIKDDLDTSTTDYARKFHIIQNSIFGVDIQPIATEISRLRCFLTLIVEEKVDDNAENRGIRPLPNLEFKFVTANTLKGIEDNVKGMTLTSKDVYKEVELLEDKRENYLTSNGKDKENIKQDFIILQNKIKAIENEKAIKGVEGKGLKLASWKPFKNEPCEWFDANFMFGVQDNFDIIIGNPPYGFRNVLTKEDKVYFRKTKNIEFKSGDSAELFIKICFDNYLKQNGILSFIIPKKSLYGDKWEGVRMNYWKKHDLVFIADTGKSFQNVLLEATVFGVKKSKTNSLVQLSFLKKDGSFERINQLDKELIFTKFNTCQIYKGVYPKDILHKIEAKSSKKKLVKGKLGLAIGTNFFSDEEQEYKLLKGIDIEAYKVRNNRYLKNKDQLKWENAKEFLQPKVIAQRIVSHIDNPTPHLKITACYDEEGIIITNTLISFDLHESIQPKFWLAYLNSTFVSWYLYNFVYARAVRTMDFYNFYIQQIPIPVASQEQQEVFVRLVDYVLFLKTQDLETAQDRLLINFLTQIINGLVFELYYSESMKADGKDIFKFMWNIPDITVLKSCEEKLETIRQTLKPMQELENSVAQNLYYLDSVSEIRVIYSQKYNR
ncbi:Eco57I restriction-modification methylase domain-containing protein [Bernardetia sp. OM2101]|uniref:Eco57I restriction-modification methylase domain-containing protein n=1 Tax=Bernardetia sp. OM2101 TaxID=3344876 RepID=UPI0035D08D5F